MAGIIDTVRTNRTLQYDSRIGLNDQGQVQKAGRQHFGNVFARAWDCITRSSEQVQKNKDVAQAFVQEIKEKYGNQVASMASRELKSHLELGRPLTAYRVMVVLTHSNEMRNQIAAKNDGLLADNLEAITERALKGAFGYDNLPDFLNTKVLKAMDRAIVKDPQFSRVDGSRDEPKFIKHCALIGQRALEQFRDELALGERMGVPPSVVAELRNADCPINEDTLQRLNVETGFTLDDVKWLSGQGISVSDTLMKFTPEEVALLREAGLGVQVGLQYKERDIPIHPRTLIGDYTDSNIQGKPEALRGGALSKPFAVNYQLPTGEADRRVFKEAHPTEGFGPAAMELGIDPKHPQMTVRNIATKVIDELLGFNLVPDTRIGMMDGKLGMVMSFAHGAAAATHQEVDVTDSQTNGGAAAVRYAMENIRMGLAEQSSLDEYLEAFHIRITEEGRLIQSEMVGVEHNFNDPALRQELVKLQLLDALTAQGDRHGGNYVVLQGEDGKISLQAIDNDQAFGTKFDNPNDLWRNPQRPSNFKAVKLPPVVDRSMVEAFSKLSPEQLRGELAGLLPDTEIEKTVERLNVIKQYLTSGSPPVVLPSDGPDDWGTEQVGQLLLDPTTSYVGRDQMNLELSKQEGLPILNYEEAVR